MRAKGMRGRVVGFGAATSAVLASMTAAGSVPARAASTGTIPGTLTATEVTGAYQTNQLFAGSDGQMWFVTPESQLGEISASGQATLTDITLPHGASPALIAAAGPEGVWTYGNTYANQSADTACLIGLVTPDGVLHDMALPAGPVRNQSICRGAAADDSGNLWISLASNSCYTDPCKVAVIAEMTPTGKVTTFAPYRPGARPSAMALGSDGSMLVLEGFRDQAMVSYTSAGEVSSLGIYARPGANALFGVPDGKFWVQIKSAFVLYDSVTGTLSAGRVLADHTRVYAQIRQTGVDADGAVWQAGQMGVPGTGVNRFFRLDTELTITRTQAFPSAADGSQLVATGALAVSSTGVVWAVADSGAGSPYLVRFQPLP
jgi:streptogramin lyase